MLRSLGLSMAIALAGFPGALMLSSTASAQQDALVCYYGSRDTQQDADSCKIGGDLSKRGTTQLNPRCKPQAKAFCVVGNSGPCNPGSSQHSLYRVIDRAANEVCPPSVRQKGNPTAQTGGQGATPRNPRLPRNPRAPRNPPRNNPQVVTPSCPPGFSFNQSSGQCIRQAANNPRPSCQNGFSFQNGRCVRSRAGQQPTPTRGPSRPQIPQNGNSGGSDRYLVIFVSDSLGVKSTLELDGASICVEERTPNEAALKRYFRANNLSIQTVPLRGLANSMDGYEAGRCDGLAVTSNDYDAVATGLRNAQTHSALPEDINCPRCGQVGGTTNRPVRPNPVRQNPQPTGPSLATELQMELKRIGCLPGAVDGIWGRGSQAALARFINATGLTHLNRNRPTDDAVNAAMGEQGRVCQQRRRPQVNNTPRNNPPRSNPRPRGGQQACVQRCDAQSQQCQQTLTRLGDSQGWDGDLRQDYWNDNCAPAVNACKFACNPPGPLGPGECRFMEDGEQICS